MQEVLQRVHDNGYVYKGLYEGWYCPRCADFKTENEIGPDNSCPIHHIPLVREHEENWFFASRAFQERARASCTPSSPTSSAARRCNEALSFIKCGLQDVSLSARQAHLGRAGAVGRRATSSTSGSTRC